MQISPVAGSILLYTCSSHAHKTKKQGWHQIRVKLRLISPLCILTRSFRWSSLRQKCTGPSPLESSPCFSAGFPEGLLFLVFTIKFNWYIMKRVRSSDSHSFPNQVTILSVYLCRLFEGCEE